MLTGMEDRPKYERLKKNIEESINSIFKIASIGGKDFFNVTKKHNHQGNINYFD